MPITTRSCENQQASPRQQYPAKYQRHGVLSAKVGLVPPGAGWVRVRGRAEEGAWGDGDEDDEEEEEEASLVSGSPSASSRVALEMEENPSWKKRHWLPFLQVPARKNRHDCVVIVYSRGRVRQVANDE